MKTIKVPFGGKGYKVFYRAEIVDVNMMPVEFINVNSVFVENPELQKIVGEHFTILHNPLHNPKPAFSIKSNGDVAEMNLKKTIAQQIMNNPPE